MTRPPLAALSAVVAVGVLAAFSWQRAADDRYASLKAEASALLLLMRSAADEAATRLHEAERRHALHLASIARRVDEALEHRRAPAASVLSAVAGDAQGQRIYLLDGHHRVTASGHRTPTLRPDSNGMLSVYATRLAEELDVGRTVNRLDPAPGELVVEGLRRNAFGTRERFGVALGRADGGAVVVRTDAEALARLRHRFGIGALLERARAQDGITDVKIHENRHDASGPDVNGGALHARVPLEILGRPPATLEIALSTRHADEAVARTRTQVLLWSAIALILLGSARTWIAFRERIAAAREQGLRAAAEDERRLADMGALGGLMAHELRNPLNAIHMGLALLDAPAESSRAARAHKTVRSEARRMVETLERFMALARQPTPDPERVGSSVLDAVVARVKSSADAVGVRLRVERGPGIVLAESLLVEQALTNVVRNAIGASGEGDEVELAWSADERAVRIKVSDHGPGFGADRDGVFRVGARGRPGGHGLGLPLARRYVTAAGGRLRLADRPAGGAAVTLEFPRAEATP